MKSNGFIRVASATIECKIGNCIYNSNQIIKIIEEAIKEDTSLIVFPELSITGYSCNDLFYQDQLLKDALNSLISIKNFSINKNISIIIGLPIKASNKLYNCAAFICNGKILGLIPKTHLQNNFGLYEARWFSTPNNLLEKEIIIDNEVVPFGTDLIFTHSTIEIFKIGIEISEDLWAPIPKSSYLSLNGAIIIANLSAQYELIDKIEYRKQLIATQSAKTISAYIYSSAGFGESTTDYVYGGHCIIYENNNKLNENQRFQLNSNYITSDIDLEYLDLERIKNNIYDRQDFVNSFRYIAFNMDIPNTSLKRVIDSHPFVPRNRIRRDLRCKDIFSMQTTALAKRLKHINCNKVIIGVSGGLDSTLAFLVCYKTFELLGIDIRNIVGVTMPGFGTTNRTYTNATLLIQKLGASFKEISIKEACTLHFKNIGHDPSIHDITFENVQARERTQILMDLSNKENAIVIGTGDLSELALGWTTYNGDHMSMYNVNSSVPKTIMSHIIKWVVNEYFKGKVKNILNDILLTPVSPELLPPSKDGTINQITEDTVGPYELHDFFLYYLIRFGYQPSKIYFLATMAFKEKYTNEEILKWLEVFYKRFFSQQFKRSCMPDGPKIGSVSLSPRGSWLMPSDSDITGWLTNLESIKNFPID